MQPLPQSPNPAQASTAKDADESIALTRQLAFASADEAGSSTGAASTNGEGPAGIVPLSRGFNASLGVTSQHDSAAGWLNILTPNVAYRFSPSFSANLGLPVFSYINIAEVIGKTAATSSSPATFNYGLRTESFLLGDTTLAGEFEAHPRLFDYNLSGTLGMPTGDDENGLGAGQFTYNFNNHFEHPLFNRFTPALELGIGNSPNLTDSRVRKSYTDVGTNAHFQFGFDLWLPFSVTFSTNAFEDLPLTTQTVTSVTSNGKKGKALRTVTTTAEKSIGEDNGFLNTLDIPLSGHVTLSGFYNRSLRNKIDTAGFSLTFLLRGTPHGREADTH